MKNSLFATTALAAGLGLATSLWLAEAPVAQTDQSTMSHGGTAGAEAPSSVAYKQAMDAMMKAMMAEPTGKPDLDFVQGMIPHHEGAIAMANVVLEHGKDAEIKKLAEDIIKAQQSEIVMMKQWLASVSRDTLVSVPEGAKAREKAMADMMKGMMVPYTGNADVDFVTGMIPHHQGAIDEAKIALQYGKDPMVLKLANDIVSAQQGEIAFMTEWLKKNAP